MSNDLLKLRTYVYICMHICSHECRCPQRPEEVIRPPEPESQEAESPGC
ncbi:rCG54693, isoform CRA_a [Rattus norvegicus]|uniref:RCG54693, isoform CRA_a n=1 Tax=Rattus norvegicus TaxID=10116 RepID=A6KFN0_RAT|nr:rCG54693, isoform CRA_a [Rattus norvegicus]EDL75972.1 rCG54693, isoform CRA_a [Rattus norvegicus]